MKRNVVGGDPDAPRVLARRLAEDLRNVRAGGPTGYGPTPKVTEGLRDITNGTDDNDGPDPDAY